MKRKGISLIVLVITIVVIIILAAAVILSLGENNPINNAKEAKVKTTIDNLKSDLLMSISKITADSLGQIAVTDIDAPGEKYQVVDLIPSIKGTEYEEELIVVDGKIQIKSKSSLPIETQIEINNAIGQSITASVVKNNSDSYYGKVVNFKDRQSFNNWKLFYADNTNIYLIAGDYIPVSMLPENVFDIGTENVDYCVKSTKGKAYLISMMLDSTNFEQFKDTNEKALSITGGPTVQQFAESYNSISHPNSNVKTVHYLGNDTDGYYVSANSEKEGSTWFYGLNRSESLYIIQNEKIVGYWIASGAVSGYTHTDMLAINIDCLGIMGCGSNKIGLRPVVKLNNNVSLVDAGDGTFNLE